MHTMILHCYSHCASLLYVSLRFCLLSSMQGLILFLIHFLQFQLLVVPLCPPIGSVPYFPALDDLGAYRLVYYDHVTIAHKQKDGCLRRQAISKEDSESLVSDLS